MRLDRRTSLFRYLTAASIGLAIVLVAVTIPLALNISEASERAWTWPLLVVSVISGALAAFALLLLFRLISRVQYRDVRVAVTGLPGAGKTVFSVLLFDALMSPVIGGPKFTAEARTVMSVYRATRGLADGQWPMSTPRDIVNRYEGRISFGPRSVVDLELGDSAGEYWAEMSDEGSRDADYLNYIVSADAVVHVVAADRILAGDSTAQDELDLKLAARLARNVGADGLGPSLLLVVSKMDLVAWPSRVRDDLRFSVRSVWDPEMSDQMASLAGRGWLEFQQMAERLQSDFRDVVVTFSSYEPREVAFDRSESVSRWLFEAANRARRARPRSVG